MRRYALLAAVAALAAACTSNVDGSPSPHPSATTPVPTTQARTLDPSHVTVRDTLGNPSIVDTCSMIALADLPAQYTRGRPPGFDTPMSVDTCAITMGQTSSDIVRVEWGMLQDAGSILGKSSKKPTSIGHGLRVLPAYSPPDSCGQFLVFADDITMNFRTDTYDGKPTDLCAVNQSMIDLVVKSLLAKQPDQRVMPDLSLAHEDACAWLTPDIADSLPGAAGAKTDRTFPAHHMCHYTAPHVNIELVFTVVPDDVGPLEDEQPVDIAGKPSYQSQDYSEANGSSCFLTTDSMPSQQSRSHRPAHEGLELLVFTDGKAPTLCADATKLAEKIWPKLPI